jgi:hypothetical protein
MGRFTDFPVLVFVVSFAVLLLASWIGASVIRRELSLAQDTREEFGVILAATLTLLGLIIGFSFSMALERYDQRKNYEEAEANAIGTEYLRLDFLPPADAASARLLLKRYVEQRILFYTTRGQAKLKQVNVETARLQDELWAAVRGPAAAQDRIMDALAVAGMNDVINSQGYTQAAWWNRIPPAAWILLLVIAVLCNLMVGFNFGRAQHKRRLIYILPFIVSIAFLLIADIDSPRGGMIRVKPQNLISLMDSLH